MEEDGVVSLIENRSLTPDEIGLLASLITDEPDHYTVLGVNRDATFEEIQAAYCLAVEYFHPLKSRNTAESDSVMHWKLSSAFLRIKEAFSVLSRRSRSKTHDDKLSGQPGRPAQYPQLNQNPNPRQSLQSERSGGARKPLEAIKGGPKELRRVENPNPRQSLQSERSGAARKPLEAIKGGTKEPRRAERAPLKLPLRVSFDRHWQELTETMDLSPLGVRFRLSHPVEPGTELRLEMPMPEYLRTNSYHDEPYVVRAFVIYAADHDSGRQVVAEFI